MSATPPAFLYQSFWNFTFILIMVWRYACAFYRILKYFFFSFFFYIFILDFFHASILWKYICSRYLVSATPPTVLNRSFWNFTDVLIMLWRYACTFYRILKLLFYFFYIFNLDFFASLQVCCERNSSYSFITILLKLHRDLIYGLKICMWFLQNLDVIIFKFFTFLT